jgi:hypothetical protein
VVLAATLAGATAAPTATVLNSTDATTAIKLRWNFEPLVIFFLPLGPASSLCGLSPFHIQELCQTRNSAIFALNLDVFWVSWRDSPPAIGNPRQPAFGNIAERPDFDGVRRLHPKGTTMLRGIIGAIVGEKLAARSGNRVTGALIGAGVASAAKRGLGPLGAALAAGYGMKKLLEWRRSRRAPAYPSDAAPVSPPPSSTRSPG